MKRPYMIAVGRCPNGLNYEGQREYEEIRYVFLLLAAENARSYLYGLHRSRVFFRTSPTWRGWVRRQGFRIFGAS